MSMMTGSAHSSATGGTVSIFITACSFAVATIASQFVPIRMSLSIKKDGSRAGNEQSQPGSLEGSTRLLGVGLAFLPDCGDQLSASGIVIGDPGWGNGAGRIWIRQLSPGGGLMVVKGLESSFGWGARIALAGDLDEDKCQDLLVASIPLKYIAGNPVDQLPPEADGRCRIAFLSGRDCSVIRVIEGPINRQFGRGLCSTGDLDRDGMSDILVGDLGQRNSKDSGRVHAYSGRTGERIFSCDGPAGHWTFGQSVLAIDDINGDGLQDFAVSDRATGYRPSGDSRRSRVSIRSGLNGLELYEIDRGARSNDFGGSMAVLADIDGDAFSDLAVGCASPEDGVGLAAGERIGIYSGATGLLVRELAPPEAMPEAQNGFGASLAALGDVNSDGVPDIAVSAVRAYAGGAGMVLVYSGKDGQVIQTHGIGGEYGLSMIGGRDYDGDGQADLLLGASCAEYYFTKGGAAVFSTITGSRLTSIP